MPWPVTRITSASGRSSLARFENGQAVQVVHHQVGDDDVELLLLDLLGSGSCRWWRLALVADPFQALGHGFGQGLFVVDDQHAHGRRRGFGIGR